MLEPWMIEELERYRRRDQDGAPFYAELPAWTGIPPEPPPQEEDDRPRERGVIVLDIAGDVEDDEA